MKIGIDFHAAEQEGSGNCTYIRNLVESLLQIDNNNEYFLYITNSNHPYYSRFKSSKNTHLRLIPSHNFFLRSILMGIKTFIDKINILHVQYTSPPFYKGKLVVTVHDISFVRFPHFFSFRERLGLKLLTAISVKKAHKVLTVSKYSCDDIINHYNIPLNKIKWVYNGLNKAFTSMPEPNVSRDILKSYGIHNNFILYVGRIDPRKNIFALIDAFLSLKQNNSIPHKLVIVGKEHWLSKNFLKDLEQLRQNENILFIDYAPPEDLLHLYHSADVFVYPSLYEGFGLPCIEALACGCPVVAGKNSALSEIINDAGLLVENPNAYNLATAISYIISNQYIRSELKGKGLNRSKIYNWDHTAKIVADIFSNL